MELIGPQIAGRSLLAHTEAVAAAFVEMKLNRGFGFTPRFEQTEVADTDQRIIGGNGGKNGGAGCGTWTVPNGP